MAGVAAAVRARNRRPDTPVGGDPADVLAFDHHSSADSRTEASFEASFVEATMASQGNSCNSFSTPPRNMRTSAAPRHPDSTSSPGPRRQCSAAELRMMKSRPPYVIDPRKSMMAQNWDLVIVASLVFTALVTPYEVSFLPSPRLGQGAGNDALFYCNRVVDVIFALDLLLQFFIMYPVSSAAMGTKWVEDHRRIVCHYLRTWFFLDAVALGASAVDFYSASQPTPDSSRGLRVARTVRLLKLLRLVRVGKMFKRWESRIAINYAALAVGRSVGLVLLGCHWFACLWALQTTMVEQPVALYQVFPNSSWVPTWVGAYGYCKFDDESNLDFDGRPLPGLDQETIDDLTYSCVEPWAMYVACLYWAVMTITSIGYGDIAAARYNTGEQLFASALMLLGGFLWGQVIGTFCGVIATYNPAQAEFNENMDNLNHFMAQHGLSAAKKQRLREYFHQTKHLQMARTEKQLLGMMSPMLQAEVALATSRQWVQRVVFLRGAEPSFTVQVSLALVARVYAPTELTPPGYLYIVHRGIALYGALVLTAGKVWGEDVILQSPHLRSRACARAMNYLEVFTIDRFTLLGIAERYPETFKAMKRAAVYMALKRYLINNLQANASVEEKAARLRKTSRDFIAGFHGGDQSVSNVEPPIPELSRPDSNDADEPVSKQSSCRSARRKSSKASEVDETFRAIGANYAVEESADATSPRAKAEIASPRARVLSPKPGISLITPPRGSSTSSLSSLQNGDDAIGSERCLPELMRMIRESREEQIAQRACLARLERVITAMKGARQGDGEGARGAMPSKLSSV